MTPKEKAKELVEKFYKQINYANQGQAKQCAIIAVEEIIEAVKIAQTDIQEYWDYWGQVLNHLKNKS